MLVHKHDISLETMAADLKTCKEKSNFVFKPVPTSFSDSSVICDVSNGNNRPFIPKACRRPIFQQLNELLHPGVPVTTKLITKRFVWPKINSDGKRWTRSCVQCRSSSVQRNTIRYIGKF